MESDLGKSNSVAVSQTVGSNAGQMVAVQAVQGDVIVDTLYSVQVYALTATSRDASWDSFVDTHSPPYKFLAPYTARDRQLFKGRDTEAAALIQAITNHPVVVVYGPAGVGKTSLLAAGVVPELLQLGALVVHIHDYGDIRHALSQALAASAPQLGLQVSADGSLLETLRQITAATQGSLVLILDQFERVFERGFGAERRQALVRDLDQSLATIPPTLLRLVLVVQDDVLGQAAALHDELRGILQATVAVQPLSAGQAEQAILEPLAERGYPISFVGSLVQEQLIPDLDDLSPATTGIYPPHLQIVCHWLYEAACFQRPPHVDEQLYTSAKGADGIVAKYMQTTLRVQFADCFAQVCDLLVLMAAPGIGRWVEPSQLAAAHLAQQETAQLLERLVEAKILVRQDKDGRALYTFTGEVVLEAVRRLAELHGQDRDQALAEAERVWAAWLVRDTLAGRNQLRFLQKHATALSLNPASAVLLVRSAVTHLEPASPWLAYLQAAANQALIRHLNASVPTRLSNKRARSNEDKISLLLGLRDAELPDLPDAHDGYGCITWAAVRHPEPTIRRSAMLVLGALGTHEAINQLRWALTAIAGGNQRRWRNVELRVALADAEPGSAKLTADLGPVERMWFTLWHVWRIVFRDRYRLVRLTLGGAIGAGLAVACQRAAVIALAGQPFVGTNFAIYFFFTALIGAATAFGIAVADPLLGHSISRESTASEGSLSGLSRLGPAAVGVALGTLGFGLSHAGVVALMTVQPSSSALVVALGFVAGLGLNLALCGQPAAGLPLPASHWLARLGLVSVVFALLQHGFALLGRSAQSLTIGLSQAFFESAFGLPQLALLDHAAMGVLLVLGMSMGLSIARRRFERWRALVERTGD